MRQSCKVHIASQLAGPQVASRLDHEKPQIQVKSWARGPNRSRNA
jgi:hypothetical protein